MDFDSAVEFGRSLERMRRLESDVTDLRRDVGEIQTLVRRGALLLALWGGSLVLVLSSDKGPDIIAQVIQRLMAKN